MSVSDHDEQCMILPLNYYDDSLYYLAGSIVTIDFKVSIAESDPSLLISTIMYISNGETNVLKFIDKSSPSSQAFDRRDFIKNATGHS